MRKLSNDRMAPGAPVVREMAGRTVWTASFRFITPVFGGGVQVDGHKKPFDPVTPVRVPSIRGQLRFWWRAVNPRRCTAPEQLAMAEAEVFGEAAKPGGVQSKGLSIRVLKQPGNPREVRPLQDGNGFAAANGMREIAYGAFPLRDSTGAHQHGVLHEYTNQWEVEFSMAPTIESDLCAALWAWSHFGGLGGRTRRGFGAIACCTSSWPNPAIEIGWHRWELQDAPHVDWPHLRGQLPHQCVRSQNFYTTGLDAQKRLLGQLQSLRQGVTMGRNPGQNGRPGRSRWPEPDEIRRLTKRQAPQHAPAHPVSKFPRAAYGTPIIFHFQTSADPADSTLNPEGRGRFASPLVLRPAQENGQYVARALRLHGTMPAGFALTVGNTTHNGLATQLTTQEANLVTPLGGEIDPIARYFELL